jgi:hypothetical protein
VDKPSQAYFDLVRAALPALDPARTLVIGDSLTSDIAGGIAWGTDSCWLCPNESKRGAAADKGLTPPYVIAHLRELLDILFIFGKSAAQLGEMLFRHTEVFECSRFKKSLSYAEVIFGLGTAAKEFLIVGKFRQSLLADHQDGLFSKGRRVHELLHQLLSALAAKQLVDSDLQLLGQRQKQRNIGHGLPRFPLGNGLGRHPDGLGKSILGQPSFAAKTANGGRDGSRLGHGSGFGHSSFSFWHCTFCIYYNTSRQK